MAFGFEFLHSESEQMDLFVADGQLKSHPMEVFITRDIADDMKPRLVLAAGLWFFFKQPGGRLLL
jgi:hypothetical protein